METRNTNMGNADRSKNENLDPITKEPGAHPAGTGVGAAVGGAAGIGAAVAAGAAMGTVIGPIGTAVGAAVGAVVGGLAGKGVAENVNPTAEHDYWRNNYKTRPYVTQGSSYDQYAPAYQQGWETRSRSIGKKFEDVESDLARNWDKSRGTSSLKWDQAKSAARDAWDRVGS